MSKHEIQICIECKHPTRWGRFRNRIGGKQLLQTVTDLLKAEKLDNSFQVRPVACLGNCSNRCRLAVTGNDRWTWSLGGVHPSNNTKELACFLRRWLDVKTGLIPKPRRSKWLIQKALGRNPPLK